MKNENTKLEKYLLGKMDAEERTLFLEEVERNPQLKAALQLEEDLIRGIEKEGYQQMKARLDRIHEQAVSQKTMGTIRRLSGLRIAAGILLVATVAVLLFVWLGRNPSGTNELFASNYEPYAWEVASRGGDAAALESVISWYEAEEYQKVVSAINALPPDEWSRADVQLALGTALLETGIPPRPCSHLPLLRLTRFSRRKPIGTRR
jgi:hypothetical protein